jgi:hypothetical protein
MAGPCGGRRIGNELHDGRNEMHFMRRELPFLRLKAREMPGVTRDLHQRYQRFIVNRR